MRNGATLASGQDLPELPQSKLPLLVNQNPIIDVEENQGIPDVTVNAP